MFGACLVPVGTLHVAADQAGCMRNFGERQIASCIEDYSNGWTGCIDCIYELTCGSLGDLWHE